MRLDKIFKLIITLGSMKWLPFFILFAIASCKSPVQEKKENIQLELNQVIFNKKIFFNFFYNEKK